MDNKMKTRYIEVSEKNLEVFQALASKTRIDILTLLRKREMSVGEIAKELDMSSSAITKHINTLESVDLIESYSKPGERGLLKLCSIKTNELQVIIDNNYEKEARRFTEIEIPIGSYTSFDVQAPCGLASHEQIIGSLDDPRYFVSPERIDSSIIWFSSGYLEYGIPIYEIDFNRLIELEISMEISSEFPGYNNSYESDIYFHLNGIALGTWRSPGDFGGVKGMYTPDWWTLGSEYGLLKIIRINEEGVFLDGIQLAKTPLSSFVESIDTQFSFRISSPLETEHPGGINLFGKGFGNFDQDIRIKAFYAK